MHICIITTVGRGWGYSKVVVTFNHTGESFNLLNYHHWGCLNYPIFPNLGLCAACWVHFMCHHEFWPTSVSHPFSSLDNCLGLAGGKHYPKIINPIFSLVLVNFALPGCFLIFRFKKAYKVSCFRALTISTSYKSQFSYGRSKIFYVEF